MVNDFTEKSELRFLLNPIVLSALLCSLVIYSNSGVFSAKRIFFTSGIKKDSICVLYGRVKGNPFKQRQFYKVTLDVFSAESKDGVRCSGKGRVEAYIPEKFVEKWYPGKLYTESDTVNGNDIGIPVEDGTNLILSGYFSSDVFYAQNIVTKPFSAGIYGRLLHFRALCRLQFKRLMFAWGEAGGLLLALLSGSREYVDDNLSKAFKSAGLSHIMALSGMHLSLFSGIAVFLGKKAKNKKIEFLLQSLFILFFVWFAGISPSLFRALLCSSLMLFSSLVGSRPRPLHILSWAFLLHVFIFPEHVFFQAFILSYGALAGILTFGEVIKPAIMHNVPELISSNFSSSLGAQIFTAPYSLFVFKAFMPICTVATIIVSPAVTAFMYFGLLFMVLSFFLPFLSSAFGVIMQLFYYAVKIPVIFFSKMPAFYV
ncbi:ComEC/Rec2 family competence protein [Treponema parvum]|uniref:ComEC/Rec2 family competence protein n=1 Tax=Treponema parvum TaxID=138851 RepID=UPI001AEBA775|nr:ComEC/Rec2 family competence protein [Treponema parvum]QTQ16188.1 ComEC/Rec2 family competence protein [Treponema parvum]